MTDRELMQQSLEALEFYYDQHGEESDARVIAALRERLAQLEQEPVAWYDAEKDCAYTLADCEGRAQDDLSPLYLAPASKPWVGLTEEDANQLVEDCDWFNDPIAFCFDVAAKLREKNA